MKMTNHGVYNFMDAYIKAYIDDYKSDREVLTRKLKNDNLVSHFLTPDWIEYLTRKVEEEAKRA